MKSPPPLVSRVDHLTIRIDDARYDQLFAAFAMTLGLPIAWPVAERYPNQQLGFKSGGIAAGNIDLEIFRAGAVAPPQAQLYSIAFELARPLEQSLQALDARGIPHLPPLAVPQDVFGEAGKLWTLVMLGDLLGADLARFPPLPRGAPGHSVLALRFDEALRDGMVFLCSYNTAIYDPAAEREKKQAELQAIQGGPLGVVRVREVVVGAMNLAAAHAHWYCVLDPWPVTSLPVRWQLQEGPTIRLLPAAHDGVLALVWQVASLERAAAFLRERGMLGSRSAQQITIDPAALLGLEAHLVE
jgi:hypothetical protein